MNTGVHRTGYLRSPAQSQPLFKPAVGSTRKSDVVAVGAMTLLDLTHALKQVNHAGTNYTGTDGHERDNRRLRCDWLGRRAGMTG